MSLDNTNIEINNQSSNEPNVVGEFVIGEIQNKFLIENNQIEINGKKIKELTGDDNYFARQTHEERLKFKKYVEDNKGKLERLNDEIEEELEILAMKLNVWLEGNDVPDFAWENPIMPIIAAKQAKREDYDFFIEKGKVLPVHKNHLIRYVKMSDLHLLKDEARKSERRSIIKGWIGHEPVFEFPVDSFKKTDIVSKIKEPVKIAPNLNEDILQISMNDFVEGERLQIDYMKDYIDFKRFFQCSGTTT